MALTQIQEEIARALNELSGKADSKARITEALLAKKIRELNKLDAKKKAGIALADLEAAVSHLEEDGESHYALTVNSANELLIEKRDESKPLTAEAHHRRSRSEKAMTLLKGTDLSAKQKQSGKKGSGGKQHRTKRESLSIYGDWQDSADE
ncbi:MAG: hypothetical protein J6S81_06760 [Treponema sp.]|nr:hypothetical protein [Treponema sp.]